MSKKKVADIIIETLQAAGVQCCYGIIGDTLNHVTDAIRRSDIEWVHMRHEEAGAMAAGGEALITGRLTACAGTCGPDGQRNAQSARHQEGAAGSAGDLTFRRWQHQHAAGRPAHRRAGKHSDQGHRLQQQRARLRRDGAESRRPAGRVYGVEESGLCQAGRCDRFLRQQRRRRIDAGAGHARCAVATGPELLDVKVNRCELVMPPKVEVGQVLHTALYSADAIIAGRGKKVEELVRTNFAD